ncbi:MAG: J domain-containing protein [Oscillospiraceae bacterium]
MTDPYRVLGVNPASTTDEIKAAYRALLIKYSAENDAEPTSSSRQRLDELNDAFDRIISEKRVGYQESPASGDSMDSSYAESASQAGSGEYFEIRNLINSNNILAAEQRLMSISNSRRDGEWNYLMGSVCHGKGWLDEARKYYAVACDMEPQNSEYSFALGRLDQYRKSGSYKTNSDDGRGEPAGPRYSRNSACGGSDCMDTACCCLMCSQCMDCGRGGC